MEFSTRNKTIRVRTVGNRGFRVPLLVMVALAVLPAALRAQTQRPLEEIANKVYNPVSFTLMGNPGSNSNTLNCTSAPTIALSTQQIFNCTYDEVNKALFITLVSPLPASQGGTGQTGYGSAGQCLQSGGAGQAFTWGTCGSGGSGLPSGGLSSQVLIGGSPSTWGSVPAAALPAPTASTLGGIESITAAAHNWISYIDATGVPHQSQPAFTDITGTVSAAQIPNVPTEIASAGSVSDPGGANYYEFCNYSAGCTFTAPAGAAGLQRCYRNSTGVTGVMTIQMPSSNTVDMNGANGSSGGYLSSGGALGDSVCIASDATNHWYAYAGGGTWTNH